jgi:Ca2+-binding RTX toxin-like protein
LGGTGADTIKGGAGDDAVEGNQGGDLIEGGAGRDTIAGGHGSDTLDGGSGDDLLTGNQGADSFVFSEASFGHDTITDFGTGQDLLDFSQLGLSASALDTNGDNVIDANDASSSWSGGNLQISAGGGLVELIGVNSVGLGSILL